MEKMATVIAFSPSMHGATLEDAENLAGYLCKELPEVSSDIGNLRRQPWYEKIPEGKRIQMLGQMITDAIERCLARQKPPTVQASPQSLNAKQQEEKIQKQLERLSEKTLAAFAKRIGQSDLEKAREEYRKILREGIFE